MKILHEKRKHVKSTLTTDVVRLACSKNVRTEVGKEEPCPQPANHAEVHSSGTAVTRSK